MNPTLVNQLRAACRPAIGKVCCFHQLLYKQLGWVDLVEVDGNKVIIHHSYPEDIDIKPYVKNIIKQAAPPQVVIELSFNRIDLSQARGYRERRDV